MCPCGRTPSSAITITFLIRRFICVGTSPRTEAHTAFLVDEAHNLVDRAREMFSADLDGPEILDVKRAIKAGSPALLQGPDPTAHGDAETGQRHRIA